MMRSPLALILIVLSMGQLSGIDSGGFDLAPALNPEESMSSGATLWTPVTEQETTEVPATTSATTDCMKSTVELDPVDLPSEITSQAVNAARCSCPKVWAPCTPLFDKLRARLEPICHLSRQKCDRELK
jgi:hypothetical protein